MVYTVAAQRTAAGEGPKVFEIQLAQTVRLDNDDVKINQMAII